VFTDFDITLYVFVDGGRLVVRVRIVYRPLSWVSLGAWDSRRWEELCEPPNVSPVLQYHVKSLRTHSAYPPRTLPSFYSPHPPDSVASRISFLLVAIKKYPKYQGRNPFPAECKTPWRRRILIVFRSSDKCPQTFDVWPVLRNFIHKRLLQ
jgi:hypothetical protein